MGEQKNTAISLVSEKKLFEKAIQDCDTSKIKKIISCGFYINEILTDLPPLSLALSKRHFKVVELLISSGADVCQLDVSGKFAPMFFAIKNKCPQNIIRRLILAGAPLNGVVEYNYRSTALHLAVYGNQKSVIKCLLSLSVDINCKDKYGMTPLHIAVQGNHPNIVKMLALKGAKLDAECLDKFTPLMQAIHDNNSVMSELLVSLGSNVNHEPEEPKYSYQKPLNYAAGLGHVEIVRLLFDHGADGKPTTGFNETPLHSVAQSNKLTDKSIIRDIIQIIIERGGDLYCYNNVGHNPFHSSIITKNTVVAKFLLKAGTFIANITRHSDTPLHLAAAVGDSVVAKLLLQSGADRTAINITGVTPYELALRQADTETVRVLWCYGQPYDDAKLDFQGEINEGVKRLIKEQKQFCHAIELGCLDKLVNALENGAEPKGCSLFLKRPLHYLVSRHYEKLVHELLERGVSAGILDENGETALHIACKLGYLNICLDLLAHGACYNYAGRCGKIPCQMARDNKHVECVLFLKLIHFLFCCLCKSKEQSEVLINTLGEFWSSNCVDADDTMLRFTAILNCVNSKGQTLLNKALSNGFKEVAQQILFYRLKYLKPKYQD